MTIFVTPEEVAAQLGVATPDAWMTTVCDAVNALANSYDWNTVDGRPTAMAKAGCVLFAGRLYRRRNSLGGIETIGSDGLATYVARTDPDIAQFLQIGPYAVPRVG